MDRPLIKNSERIVSRFFFSPFLPFSSFNCPLCFRLHFGYHTLQCGPVLAPLPKPLIESPPSEATARPFHPILNSNPARLQICLSTEIEWFLFIFASGFLCVFFYFFWKGLMVSTIQSESVLLICVICSCLRS
jgi:hypothetical protein